MTDPHATPVLLTGGTGYLGRAVLRELRADGLAVRLLTRGGGPPGGQREPGGQHEPGVQVVRGGLGDPAALREAVRGVRAVVHLAGRPHARGADDVRAVNADGSRALLEALPDGGRTPFVLASSAAVYGGTGGRLAEDAAVAPANPYGESKVLAEEHVSAAAEAGTVAAISLRCFNVAGALPGDPDRDTTRMINRALAAAAGRLGSLTINGDGGAVRDYVHVADVAAAFRLALEHAVALRKPENRCYNIGSGHGVSVTEIVEAVRALTGHPVPVLRGPAAAEARELIADPARAAHDLGWEAQRSTLGRIVHDAWTALGPA